MLLDLFLIGLVITLEPIPLTTMILLLAAERGVLKGVGFALGWLCTLVAIVAVVVVVTDGKPLIVHSSPSTAALAVKLACGAVLVFVAYRRRPHPGRPQSTESRKQPRWMTGIDRVNPLAAAGLAFLVQPWVLVTAGVATIVNARLNNAVEYLLVFLFCLWSTASILTMEIYAIARPATVKDRLNALLDWINSHTDQVIAILSLGLGLYLMAKSTYGLVSGS
jgi:threonine/homoserine/homoserine lactone efflux protein